ncbi:hypothetical protein KI688_007686 [Linnemannia hyalina]|uniref:F-box domain-containing protein n=1 Tax=Linnemannia hyalina TaxID=64524 RepID=A0A9P7XI73_9FUNG|nr:hypothetical protein KI688_007686 [Linnemannia hyalina]
MTSPTAHPPTLLTLPTEIFESVLPFLSQHDLTQCVRVSQAWNRTFVSHLWRTIDFRSSHRLKRFLTSETQQALVKNAKFVRKLSIVHKKLYHQFLPSRQTLIEEPGVSPTDVFTMGLFANLLTLELHYLRHPENDHDQRIHALVRQNPSLRRLKIDVTMDTTALMSLITKHVPNLRDLDLSVTWRGDVKALLGNLPECIRTVRLREVHHTAPGNADKASRVESGVSSTTMRHHHALESFSIGGNLAGQEEDVLFPFLKSCSQNLKSFSGKYSARFFHNARIGSALSDLGIFYTELSRHYLPPNESDANIARGISLSRNCTSIDLHICQVGPLTAAAIADNCERLEVLDVMEHGTSGLMGSHLQAVLSKATRLRTLRAHWLLATDKISAIDILSSEWATTSLEHVDFKIDVPRVGDDTLSNNTEAIQSSRDTQRQVLRRFGQQTNLRKLKIGGMAFTAGVFGHQHHCLEMTLESGLDELVGLKDLDLLDIHHMDHRVGIPELVWMYQNLPKLRYLIGMMDSFTPPSPEVRQWLQIHRPGWR